ncbi:MAG TPA: hypothetical protein VFQ51_13430 [Vicinamibacteria bacterium]|nr:hypothetical protein [Vicinamibacteria bacterium]
MTGPPPPPLAFLDPLAWWQAREQPAETAFQWILKNVPCVNGPMDPKWTDTIITRLKEARIPDTDILAALDKARAEGYDLPQTADERWLRALNTKPDLDWNQDAGAPNLGSDDRGENRGLDELTRDEMITLAQRYEAQYELGRINHDVQAQRASISGILALLWALGRVGGKMKQDRERLEQTRAEILRNAPNIARQIDPRDPRSPMETPDPREGEGEGEGEIIEGEGEGEAAD